MNKVLQASAKGILLLLVISSLGCSSSSNLEVKRQAIAQDFFGVQKQQGPVNKLNIIKTDLHDVDLISHETDSIMVSTLVDSMSYVPLETNENCFIGNIDKMMFAGKRIIVLDKYIAQSIFIFEKTGAFHAKIEKLRKGPDEVFSIDDITIDFRTGNILLLDLSDKKILTYDQDGRFLTERPVGFYVYELAMVPGKSDLALANHSESNSNFKDISLHNLIQTDSLIRPYAKAFPFSEQSGLDFHWTNPINFRTDGLSLYYYPRFTDTIYQIDGQVADARYQVNYGDSGFPAQFYKSPSDNKFEQLRGTYSYFMGDYVATPDYFYCSASVKGAETFGFYSNKTGITKSSEVIKLDGPNVIFFNKPMCNDGNIFLSAMTVREAIEGMTGSLNYLGQKNKKLLLRFAEAKENDNPIVMFYTLKPF
jgi:hypothetical protein